MRYLALLALALLALLTGSATAQTVTIPAQNACTTVPAQTVCVSLPARTITVVGTTAPTCTPPQTLSNGVCVDPAPSTAGTFWLFKDGVFKGAGDYSWGSGKVAYGSVVTVTGDEGWQPRMPGDDFDATAYHYVTISIKPTQAGNTWITGAEMVGDVQFPGCENNPPNIMKYGPNPAVVGVWNTYKIPLTAYCIKAGQEHLYKIMFAEQSSTNKAGNSVQFNALGFVP